MSRVVGGASTYSKTIGHGLAGYPQLIARGVDATVWDEEGGQYIDWTGSLGANFLGHYHPGVLMRIIDQMRDGIAFAQPTRREEQVAEQICGLTGWDQVRFCKNGSDATEAAIRLARYVTGRTNILCTGYHGSHSDLVTATPKKEGGVLIDTRRAVRAVETQEWASAHIEKGDLAAVISEPYVMGSGIWDWQYVKEKCDATGTLLIFDEVITGFRSRLGSMVDVRPHLACYGKALANGLPLALVAGPRGLMRHYEHEVFFSGTAAGELLSLAACQATLRYLTSSVDYDILRERGERIGTALEGIARGYPMRWQLILDAPQHCAFIAALAKRDILVGRDFFLMTAHTDSQISQTVEAIADVRKALSL